MARVFVGIPTVNRPHYVGEAIASVLGQTFSDVRVLVSDNASDGDTPERIERLIEGLADGRVRFHRQPTDVGEYGQGWLFMRVVRGEEFFMILHDDDVLEPTYIERAVEQLDANPSLAYFVANPRIMDADGRTLEADTHNYLKRHGRLVQREGVINVLDALFGVRRGSLRTLLKPQGAGFTPISGTFFRTAALRDSGFADEPGVRNYPFEFDVLLRVAERGNQAWFCPEPLLRFRHHGGSMTSYMALLDNTRPLTDLITLLERRRFSGKVERFRRVLLSRYRRAMAVVALKLGQARTARHFARQAMRDNPSSPRGWVVLATALAAPRLARAVLPPLQEGKFRAGVASDVGQPSAGADTPLSAQ